MENIMEFIKPELLVLIPALYFIGCMLKKSQAFADKYIPLTLGLIGIALAALWVAGTSTLDTTQAILLAVFTAIVQGVIVAGLSVYANQIYKQLTKADDVAVLYAEEIEAEEIEAEELTDEQLRAILYQMGQDPAENATRAELLAMLDAVAEKLQE